MVAVAVVALILGLLFWQPIKRYTTDTWHCLTNECNPTGPSASWHDQLAAVESAANTVDPTALLASISAHPAAYYEKPWQPNDALDLTFEYIASDGTYFSVLLLDTTPSTARVNRWGDNSYGLAVYFGFEDMKPDIDAAVDRITVTPRQAIEATFSQAGATGTFKGSDFSPLVNLSLTNQKTDRHKWSVSYSPIPFNISSLDYEQLIRWPRFTVETTSGTIENVTKTDESGVPTP